MALLTTSAVPVAMTLAEIQDATLGDPTLQQLAELIRSQQWHSVLNNDSSSNDVKSIDLQDLKAFHKIRHELTVTTNNDTILRGSRIVMPASLRHRALQLAHEGHQGLIKTWRYYINKTWCNLQTVLTFKKRILVSSNKLLKIIKISSIYYLKQVLITY